jgi:hypothetical protein
MLLRMQKSTPWYKLLYVWLAFGTVGLLGIGVYIVRVSRSTLPDRPSEVQLRPDSINPNMTEVVLLDVASRVEQKLLTLSDVYREHYHPVERVDGSVYIVKRFGDIDSSWTDELWKYDVAGKGSRIYAEPGLDFRVSREAQRIAIFTSFPDQRIVMMDLQGERIKEFSRDDIPSLSTEQVLAPLMWHGRVLWFGAFEGLSLMRLFSLDAHSQAIVAHDLSSLNVAREEFALEPTSHLLVYSDYHPRLDTADPAYQVATLFAYNLLNQKKISFVRTSTTRAFEPTWIDGTTVEYNDPASNGRTQMRLPSF